MGYDYELNLITYTTTYDELLQPIKTPVRNPVLCKKNSVGSNEFYNAKVAGLKPELKFVIHAFEYGGETEVEFEGIRYNVIRTYTGDTVDKSKNALSGEEIELTCEKVVGNG